MAARKKDSQVRLSVGGYRIVVDMPRGSEGNALPFAAWQPFSQTELKIIRALARGQAMSRAELCRKIDEVVDGRVRGILAGLTSRKVLIISVDGYALNCPVEELAAFRQWLERQENGGDSPGGANESNGESHSSN